MWDSSAHFSLCIRHSALCTEPSCRSLAKVNKSAHNPPRLGEFSATVCCSVGRRRWAKDRSIYGIWTCPLCSADYFEATAAFEAAWLLETQGSAGDWNDVDETCRTLESAIEHLKPTLIAVCRCSSAGVTAITST